MLAKRISRATVFSLTKTRQFHSLVFTQRILRRLPEFTLPRTQKILVHIQITSSLSYRNTLVGHQLHSLSLELVTVTTLAFIRC